MNCLFDRLFYRLLDCLFDYWLDCLFDWLLDCLFDLRLDWQFADRFRHLRRLRRNCGRFDNWRFNDWRLGWLGRGSTCWSICTAKLNHVWQDRGHMLGWN